MKKHSYALLALCHLAFCSCELFKEDKEYIANNVGRTSLLFVLPDTSNLVNPPAGQQLKYVQQPDNNLNQGTFLSSGDANVTVQVTSENITSIDVNTFRVVGEKIEREPRGTLAVSNKSARFIAPMATINFGGKPLAKGTSVVLEFAAKNAGGIISTRLFTLRSR